MPKIPYKKVALSYEDQLKQLQERGLVIENQEKALHLLSNLSYYRLSGYWHPFLEDKEKHIFKSAVTFEQTFKIYCFDRELKNLVGSELEKIEVALRAILVYHYSHQYGAFWYTNAALFLDLAEHSRFILNLQDCFHKSKEEFIIKFKKTYENSFPPSWMGMEIISLGALSKLYSNLRPGKTKRNVANTLNLSDTVLESWLHALTYIRNTCAHHARLWNKVLKVQPVIPTSLSKLWLKENNVSNSRLYYFMSIILYLQHSVNPHTTFVTKLKYLLNKYPEVDVKAMGFPEKWEKEELWHEKAIRTE